LKDVGISIKEEYIVHCEHGGMVVEEIENAVDKLLFFDRPPEAISTASDRICIGCFSALKKRDIKIPQQIAIAGFSNFSSPKLLCPSLTTVEQPAFQMGKLASELLIQMIESKKPMQI
jgi:DNA-binding LacI/PurR family transcriptional regulator